MIARPPPALIDACLCRPGAGDGAFAITVLFPTLYVMAWGLAEV